MTLRIASTVPSTSEPHSSRRAASSGFDPAGRPLATMLRFIPSAVRFCPTRSCSSLARSLRAEEDLHSYADRLKTTSRRLVEVQEAERRLLARELHDRGGQNLTALGINLRIVPGARPAG